MSTFFNVILIVLALYLVTRLVPYLVRVYTVLVCLCLLGIPIAFFDLDLGIKVFVFSGMGCMVLFLSSWILLLLYGAFELLVHRPLARVWTAAKGGKDR